MMTRITVLCENRAAGKGLLGEHGLAYWIEQGEHKILFDVGQGYVLTHNAQVLGIRLDTVEKVVLSHGHFDHTGGLADMLALKTPPDIYAHSAAFGARYTLPCDGPPRAIGMPDLDEVALRRRTRLVRTDTPTEICDGLYVTGAVPRHYGFEDRGGPFFIDAQGKQPDSIPDDQALYFDTDAGVAVILGCAHAGVLNTLAYVQQLTGGRPIHTIMGGMHLVSASQERIEKTLVAFQRLDIQRIMPLHCTGFNAMARLWQAFPDRFRCGHVGTVMEM